MDHPHVSKGVSDPSADIEPDSRWLGSLLCFLSAVITTVFIVLVTTSLMSTDDRDIARGDSPDLGAVAPSGGGGVAD